MGEISKMMVNGDMDYVTGEYLGRGYGIPLTKSKSDPYLSDVLNKYGYPKLVWKRMNNESKEVIKFLYDSGFYDFKSRQEVIDEFFTRLLKWKVIPKNNKKYKFIYERLDEFNKFIKIKMK